MNARVRFSSMTSFLLVSGALTAALGAPRERPLTAKDQSAVVDGVCHEVEARYVFPDIGKAMSERLKQQLASGAYARLTSPRDLAEKLQLDLREVSHDRHVFVVYDPQGAAALRAAGSAADPGILSPADIEASRDRNFGLREVRLLAGNVGYLDLRDFEHPSLLGPKLVATMALLSDSDAVIVDLRSNGGGWAETTALLASYFFAPGVRLHFTDFHDRVTGETTQSWTEAFVPGKTLPGAPLYILTSARTFSGAEEFAYNLQAMKRATVIGEKTRGGANTPADVPIARDFVLAVPQGRPTSPVTHANWEGTGVTPDVLVPEKQALDAAHALALERLVAASPSAADRQRFEWALEAVHARMHPVTLDASALQACAGSYGSRVVTFERGRLYDQRVDRPRQELLPLTTDLFAIDGVEQQRLRFVRDGGRVTAVVILDEDGSSRTVPKGPPSR